MVYADDLPLDHFRRETTRHGQREFPIQYYVDELFRFENRWVPLHWHPEPELMVARGGNVRVLLGDQEVLLVDGDGILINGNILHLFEQPLPTDRCQNPNIVFSAELIAPVASAAYQNYVKPLIEDEGLPFVVLTRDVPWQKDVLDQLDIVFALLHQYGPEGAYGKLPALPERFRDVVSPPATNWPFKVGWAASGSSYGPTGSSCPGSGWIRVSTSPGPGCRMFLSTSIVTSQRLLPSDRSPKRQPSARARSSDVFRPIWGVRPWDICSISVSRTPKGSCGPPNGRSNESAGNVAFCPRAIFRKGSARRWGRHPGSTVTAPAPRQPELLAG